MPTGALYDSSADARGPDRRRDKPTPQRADTRATTLDIPIVHPAPPTTVMNLPALSLLETRVLGVLAEKQHTVPDAYPLTLNALATGCNQKTSRDPILNATDAEIQACVDHLKTLSFVVETSGGRVMRYAHNIERVLGVPSQAVALLAALMLRGPQTVAELRQSSERLHRFTDISAVEGFLEELGTRENGGLVALLPRQPGAREARWVHLLSGMPDVQASAPLLDGAADGAIAVTEIAALKANMASLQQQVDTLEAQVARLLEELGIRSER